MREFILSYNPQQLAVGLRPSFRAPKNSSGFESMVNLVVDDEGLVSYDPPVLLANSATLNLMGITLSYPHPQLHVGRGVTLMTTSNRVWQVDPATLYLNEMTVYDYDNPTQVANIPAGDAWQLVDNGAESWILTNNRGAIIKTGRNKLLGTTDKVYWQDFCRFSVGCYHNGRLLIGGMDEDNFWHSDWISFFTGKDATLGSGVELTNNLKMTANTLMWSNVGVGLDWLFWPSKYKSGFISGGRHNTTDNPLIYDLFMRKDMGWRQMHWEGNIHAVKPLGEYAIVYGDRGITSMSPVTSPEPTYRMQVLARDLGTKNRMAVGGGNRRHVFMDARCDLWEVALNEQGFVLPPRKLGYREFFAPYSDLVWSFSWDEVRQQLYIYNEFKTFVLGRGLTEVDHRITSTARIGDNLFCLGQEVNNRLELITGEIDFGSPGIKTIQWITIGANNTDGYQVAIDYKYQQNDSWTRTSFFDLNSEGMVFIPTGGISFRVVVKATMDHIYEVEPPDYLEISYKTNDRRYKRGVKLGSVE